MTFSFNYFFFVKSSTRGGKCTLDHLTYSLVLSHPACLHASLKHLHALRLVLPFLLLYDMTQRQTASSNETVTRLVQGAAGPSSRSLSSARLFLLLLLRLLVPLLLRRRRPQACKERWPGG